MTPPQQLIPLLVILTLCATPLHAQPDSKRKKDRPGDKPQAARQQPTAKELAELDRHNAAAEKAAEAEDWDEALKYIDYSGHEQEALARATIEYGAAQAKLRTAAVERFGADAWKTAAGALNIPERPRPEKSKRAVRKEEGILYVKNKGAKTEVPYVKVDGIWKLSIRDVVFLAIKGVLGDREVEESTLFLIAGKTAKKQQERNEKLLALARDVEAGTYESAEAFQQAAAALLKEQKPARKEKDAKS